MGITRHATRIHLTTRIAGPDDRTAVPGIQLWIVDYTVTQNGRETSFSTPCVAEAAARRMVRNLLNDRLPGLDEADVYSEQLD